MAAEGLGVGLEVGVFQLRGAHPARVLALLVHTDGAEHGVVQQHHDDVQAVLHGGGKFLAVHEEVAVAREDHHLALRPQAFASYPCGQAVTHGPAGGCQLAGIGGEGPEAVDPGGKVACAVAEDGVGGQHVLQVLHHLAHLQLAGDTDRCRVAPGQVLGTRRVGVRLPRHSGLRAHRTQSGREGLRCGVDGLCRAVQLAQFVRVGVDVHQRLRGVGDGQQLVALRRHLGQTPAHHQHQVRRLDARQQFGVRPQAQVTTVTGVAGGEQHLAAERAIDGQRPGLGKSSELTHRLLGPAAAAQDGHGLFCGLQALGQLGHLRRAGVGFGHGIGQRVGHAGRFGQHVFGQGNHHRARAARCGDVEGARNQLGHPRRVVNLHHPLGHGAKHGAVVQLLKSLAPHHAAPHLAHEQDHGGRILVRDVYTG